MATAFASGAWVLVSGQQQEQVLQGAPKRQTGASITPAFEGWFPNPDGSFSFMIGYMNRNPTGEMDIPIGPNNHMDPGGPDRGQPTHFLSGRNWGMFRVTVPKDFPPKRESAISWTIVANGQPMTVPFWLHTDYQDEVLYGINGNTPPVVSFAPSGPTTQGPMAEMSDQKMPMLTATVGEPLPLTVWTSDDGVSPNASRQGPPGNRDPLTMIWSKYRGPGEVKFDKEKPKFGKLDGKAKVNGKFDTTATFSEPGEYVLHTSVDDYSGDGGGGFQCCWTTNLVKVTVKAKS